MPAPLIALVGLDGSGKTTQLHRVRQQLEALGRVVLEPEPRPLKPVIARAQILAEPTGQSVEDYLGLDLSQLVAAIYKWTGLLETLELRGIDNGVVLCDRYAYCQLAAGMRSSPLAQALIEKLFADFPAPSVTIYLHVPVSVARSRMATRGEDSEIVPGFLDQLYAGYETVRQRYDFTEVDGTGSVDEVFDRLWPIIAEATGVNC